MSVEPAGAVVPGSTGTGAASGESQLLCSVLVGRVSTREGARIFELLAAMRRQQPGGAHEIIIADRLTDGVSARIAADFPEVARIVCPGETTLPALRATALARARGRYVVVTEDHCVPADDWIAQIVATFRQAPAGVAAVGGSVTNGLPERWLDRATFQCEYGNYAPPVADGTCDEVPGMNVAYVREHLVTVAPNLLQEGFWEAGVHAALRGRGLSFLSSSRIRVAHKKQIGFVEFIRQRFWYSRHFAGNRFPGKAFARRAFAFALTPALPLLLAWRFHRAALRRSAYAREFVAALPLLAIFAVVWALGEMAGYAFGPGDALRKLE